MHEIPWLAARARAAAPDFAAEAAEALDRARREGLLTVEARWDWTTAHRAWQCYRLWCSHPNRRRPFAVATPCATGLGPWRVILEMEPAGWRLDDAAMDRVRALVVRGGCRVGSVVQLHDMRAELARIKSRVWARELAWRLAGEIGVESRPAAVAGASTAGCAGVEREVG